MRRVAARTALIGVMLTGGLLYAGISQAQDAGAPDERTAELVAAVGGPVPTPHLIPFEADRAAVEPRAKDVEDAAPMARAPVAEPAATSTARSTERARPAQIAVAAAPSR